MVARFIIALFEHIQNILSKLYFTRPFNPLSTKLTKWSNTLPARKLPTKCLSVFDHFGKLAFKGLIFKFV